jgi:hypothetical protein
LVFKYFFGGKNKIKKTQGIFIMIKGIYKEFITVKLKNNPLYEEAIFVLKQNTKEKSKQKNKDLVFEANRILCENGVKRPKRKTKIAKKIIFSLLLVLLGAIIGFIFGFLIIKFSSL